MASGWRRTTGWPAPEGAHDVRARCGRPPSRRRRPRCRPAPSRRRTPAGVEVAAPVGGRHELRRGLGRAVRIDAAERRRPRCAAGRRRAARRPCRWSRRRPRARRDSRAHGVEHVRGADDVGRVRRRPGRRRRRARGSARRGGRRPPARRRARAPRRSRRRARRPRSRPPPSRPARANRLGSLGGSSASPATDAPRACSHRRQPRALEARVPRDQHPAAAPGLRASPHLPGRAPARHRPSSSSRSQTVSMGCQKPSCWYAASAAVARRAPAARPSPRRWRRRRCGRGRPARRRRSRR